MYVVYRWTQRIWFSPLNIIPISPYHLKGPNELVSSGSFSLLLLLSRSLESLFSGHRRVKVRVLRLSDNLGSRNRSDRPGISSRRSISSSSDETWPIYIGTLLYLKCAKKEVYPQGFLIL